ncbi:DUF4167 domain-containing protein [Devosia sp.]|uniref:DUF4167 domain-containing protein n=1 Tax=Devosia sp. TaxID=1871048 RepID=UPI0035AFC8F8
MRPNQQNNKNRSRGRNNNGGRKHGNPLSRNYESNGPDVKVRGNAAHIAEKYLQLARDAQSSGDSVMAENYLQHAEHYFRILSAAQPQAGQRDQFGQQGEEDDYDDDFAPINDRFASPEPRQPYQQSQPQPEPQPIPGSEPVVMAAVEVAAPVDGETAAAAAEGEPRRHRERRPRRRSRGQGGDGVAGDPANAPQPDVGELPAFLTAGSTAAE